MPIRRTAKAKLDNNIYLRDIFVKTNCYSNSKLRIYFYILYYSVDK